MMRQGKSVRRMPYFVLSRTNVTASVRTTMFTIPKGSILFQT